MTAAQMETFLNANTDLLEFVDSESDGIVLAVTNPKFEEFLQRFLAYRDSLLVAQKADETVYDTY